MTPYLQVEIHILWALFLCASFTGDWYKACFLTRVHRPHLVPKTPWLLYSDDCSLLMTLESKSSVIIYFLDANGFFLTQFTLAIHITFPLFCVSLKTGVHPISKSTTNMAGLRSIYTIAGGNRCKHIELVSFGLVALFNVLSIFLDYLMPKPSL